MGGHARGTYPVRGGDNKLRRMRRDGSEELIPDLADPSHDIIIPSSGSAVPVRQVVMVEGPGEYDGTPLSYGLSRRGRWQVSDLPAR